MFFSHGNNDNGVISNTLYKYFEKSLVDTSTISFLGMKQGYTIVMMAVKPTIILYAECSNQDNHFNNISFQVPATHNGFSSMVLTMDEINKSNSKYPIILSRCDSLAAAKHKLSDKNLMAKMLAEASKLSNYGKTYESQATIKIDKLLNVDPKKLSNYRIAKATGIAYSRIWKLRHEGLKNIDDLQFGTIKRFVKFYDEYFKVNK